MEKLEMLDKRTEQAAVDAVKEAAALTAAGETPNDAIVKIATRNKFTPPLVSRIVEAYNATRSIAHFAEAEGAEKVASFPLADVDEVLSRMYPVQAPLAEKTAAVPEGHVLRIERPMEKAAGLVGAKVQPYRPDAGMLVKRAFGELARLKKAEELAKQTASELHYSLRAAVDKLARYCRSSTRIPFADLEKTARGHFGDVIVPLLDIVWGMSKAASFGEKRFDKAAAPCVAPAGEEPFSTLTHITFLAKTAFAAEREAIRRSAEVAAYKAQFDAATAQMMKAAGDGDKKKVAEPSASDPLDAGLSAADAAADVASAGAATYDKLTGTAHSLYDPFPQIAKLLAARSGAITPPSQSDVTDDVEQRLNTFELDAERKALSTQLMLFDFMKNDPVLRRQDPGIVISHFNEIARLAPYAAEKPVLMRSLLRRAVETRGLDPLELKNATELEEAMRSQARPISAGPAKVRK